MWFPFSGIGSIGYLKSPDHCSLTEAGDGRVLSICNKDATFSETVSELLLVNLLLFRLLVTSIFRLTLVCRGTPTPRGNPTPRGTPIPQAGAGLNELPEG